MSRRRSTSRSQSSATSSANIANMDLCPVDHHFSMNRWLLILTHGEEISISLRSFVSRDNPIEIHKWWRRLSPMTHALIELAGFKNFVELHPTEFAKKFLLYALVERWWDTTHTLHIAGVEMMITPYNIHRLMGLRVDGLILTFNTFVHAFELIGSILDWIWERLQLISLAFFMPSWKLHETQRREGLGWRGPFSYSQFQYSLMQITWAAWIGTTRTGIATTDMRAFSMAQFSWLYEGPGVRVVYMAERLTCQLGHGDDLVPMAPLQFTLFPYKAPNEVVNQWRAGFPYLERLEEDGNFEEYQGPGAAVGLDGLQDIVLPPWTVLVYRVDGTIFEFQVTRHEVVLGYPIPRNARPTMMTKYFRDRFSRPPSSSSRGTQVDPEANDYDDDDDDEPSFKRGRYD
uniref:Aminotransferase-like plant mobile domain-containing protein n=1 Tax=Fagus sylvatica TaxID=28930 RepID=A0A2N9HP90_FAGSY